MMLKERTNGNNFRICTPSCKKVVIEGKNISSLVRKEYD